MSCFAPFCCLHRQSNTACNSRSCHLHATFYQQTISFLPARSSAQLQHGHTLDTITVRLTTPGHSPLRPCRAAAATKYDVLGVTRTASDKDIKRAFRKLALKLHPDVNKEPGAAKAFTAAKEAYETLSDVRRRKEYDVSLESGRVGGPQPL